MSRRASPPPPGHGSRSGGRSSQRLTISVSEEPDGLGSATRRMGLVRCAMLAPELPNPAARIRATAWIDKLSVSAGVPGRSGRIADPYIELLLEQLEAGVLIAPFDVPVPDGSLPRTVPAAATHMRGKAGRASPSRRLVRHQDSKSARRGAGGGGSASRTPSTARGNPRSTPRTTPRAQQGGDLLERRLMASLSPKRAPKPSTEPTELIAETARWVVQNGKEFETMLKDSNRGNPLWVFLLEPQSAAAQTYRDRLQHERRRQVTERKAAAVSIFNICGQLSFVFSCVFCAIKEMMKMDRRARGRRSETRRKWSLWRGRTRISQRR